MNRYSHTQKDKNSKINVEDIEEFTLLMSLSLKFNITSVSMYTTNDLSKFEIYK